MPDVDTAIAAALDDIERQRAVRILHACESGSRAWGFASPDSDYDVRFVYVHGLTWYLRVAPGRDSIERMLPGDLDLAGWELRKTLGLFARSNAVLYEHLGSDVVYRTTPLAQQLRALIPDYFHPLAAGHHYLGLARRMHDTYCGGEQVNLKKLFYVLRPLAALTWIAQHGTMPPTAFAATLDGIELDGAARGHIAALHAAKVTAGEAATAPFAPAVRAFVAAWLERCTAQVRLLPHHQGPAGPLDELLAAAVLAP